MEKRSFTIQLKLIPCRLYSSLHHHRKSHNVHLFKMTRFYIKHPDLLSHHEEFPLIISLQVLSSPPDQDRAEPSELQSFLESLKSRHDAIPMGYKEPKSTSMRFSNGMEQGVCSPTVAKRISTLGAIHCFRTLPKSSSSSSEERDSDCFKEISPLMKDITALEKQVYFLQKLLLLRHQSSYFVRLKGSRAMEALNLINSVLPHSSPKGLNEVQSFLAFLLEQNQESSPVI